MARSSKDAVGGHVSNRAINGFAGAIGKRFQKKYTVCKVRREERKLSKLAIESYYTEAKEQKQEDILKDIELNLIYDNMILPEDKNEDHEKWEYEMVLPELEDTKSC